MNEGNESYYCEKNDGIDIDIDTTNGNDDDDHNNNDDTIINLRFDPDRMSIQTEQLINDILSQETEEQKGLWEEEGGGGGGIYEFATSASDNINNHSTMDDNNTNCNSNYDVSTSSSTTGIYAGVGGGGGVYDASHVNDSNDHEPQQHKNKNTDMYRKESVLSVRPSIMSQGTINKILDALSDSIDDIDYTIVNKNTITSISNNPCMSGAATAATSVNITNNPENNEDHEKDDGSFMDSQQKRRKKTRRRQYSISRATLDIIDESFFNENDDDDDDNDDDNDNDDNDNDKHDDDDYRPVAILSKEIMRSVFHPTEEITKQRERLLETEMNQLSFDEKGRIMFDLHGFERLEDTNTNRWNDNDSNTINEDEKEKRIEDDYLKRFDDELQLKLSWKSSNDNNTNNNNELPLPIHETDKHSDAFVEAQRLFPDYVNSKEFRLRFARPWAIQQDEIRCSCSSSAATNNSNDSIIKRRQHGEMLGIIYHFHIKKQLFGGTDYDDNILGRDIHLSDLTPDDKKVLASGFYQIMPNRDLGGRLVVVYAPNMEKFHNNISNSTRSGFYQYTVLHKDVDSMNSGMVLIVHAGSFFSNQLQSMEWMQGDWDLEQSFFLPHYRGIHLCYNNPEMKSPMRALMIHCLKKRARVRSREHCITDHNEMCFKLETFGIIIDKSILLPDGRLGLHWNNEWMRLQQYIEEEDHQQQEEVKRKTNKQRQQLHCVFDDGYNNDNNFRTTTNIVMIPTKFDVLFVGTGSDGTGGGDTVTTTAISTSYNQHEHFGNLRWGLLVEEYYEKFKASTANEYEKMELCEKVVELVNEYGGRFLKQDLNRGWQEVDHEQVIAKVVSYFSNLQSNEKKLSEEIDEDDQSNCIIYKEPTEFDVLSGRGGRSNNHPGNEYYRAQVDAYDNKYKSCGNKDERKKIVETIIMDIGSRGGNFLKKDNKKSSGIGGSRWYIVVESVAFQKVHQALRDNKDPDNRRRKRERYLAKQRKG